MGLCGVGIVAFVVFVDGLLCLFTIFLWSLLCLKFFLRNRSDEMSSEGRKNLSEKYFSRTRFVENGFL